DAGAITLSAGAGSLSFGALTAESGDLTITSSGGGVKTGLIKAGSGRLELSANGTGNVAGIDAAAGDAVSSGGKASYGTINSSGVVNLTVNGGDLQTADVTADQFFTTLDTGNEHVGNVHVTGDNFFFSLGDHAGQNLQIDGLNFNGGADVA